MMVVYENTEELLQRLKVLLEEQFKPNGYYTVNKLVRDGQTALCIIIMFDSPAEPNYYPKVEK